jgi:hypothetical protein
MVELPVVVDVEAQAVKETRVKATIPLIDTSLFEVRLRA